MTKEKNNKPFYDFFSKRENIFLIFIGLTPIFFQSLFEKLFNDYITKPIFENIESNILVDIIIILIGFGVFIYYSNKFKKGYFLFTFKTYLFSILASWYLFYRLKGGWNYLSFSIYPPISYSDIFLVIPLAYILKRLLREKELDEEEEEESSKTENNYNGFLIDEPTIEDSLGRKGYSKAIAAKIKNSYPIKYAMAIGITGKWGSGKTTFMQLIEKALSEESKPIIINFRPRKNHDSNNIIIDFFDELEETLGVYNENLSFNIHQYLKQLTTVDDNIYFKTIDFFNTIIFGKKSTQDMFDEINKAIQQIEKQVIIFIDDIDRLDSKEVIEVIKLIRFSANFNNVVFIVAFDKGYVINAINEFNTYEKEWFLEKIFQVEFPLPTFENKKLKSELEKKLISNYPEYETEFKNYFNDESNYLIIDKCILTMRDVVRFTNAFCLDFGMLKEEVLVKDFINISLLKFKYSALYEFIYLDRKKLFSDIVESELDKIYTPTVAQYFISVDSDNIKNYLKKKETLFPNKDDIDVFTDIIVKIFSMPPAGGIREILINQSKKFNTSNILSIRKPSNFGIYFSLRLLAGNLGEIDFKNARRDKYEDCLIKVNEWLELKLEGELLDKIEAINLFDNKNDFEQIIKILFHLGSTEKVKQDEAIRLIRHHLMVSESLENSNKKIYYDDNAKFYTDFLTTLFKDNTFQITFKAKLIQSINLVESSNHNFLRLKFGIAEVDRISLMCDYVRIYFEESRNIIDLIDLYDMCIIRTQDGKDEAPQIINELMLKLFLDNNKVLELFEYIIPLNKNPDITTSFSNALNNGYFKYLFPIKNNFDEFVKQIDKSVENKSLNGYIEFVEKYFDK